MYKQVIKNILYEKVGGIQNLKTIGGLKSKGKGLIRREIVIVVYLAHKTTHVLEMC